MLTFASLKVSMDSQVLVTDSINAGQPYGFKYRARNRQGWSEYSDVSYILAANVPAQILPVGVTQDGENAVFTWIEPDDGAQPITAYTL